MTIAERFLTTFFLNFQPIGRIITKKVFKMRLKLQLLYKDLAALAAQGLFRVSLSTAAGASR